MPPCERQIMGLAETFCKFRHSVREGSIQLYKLPGHNDFKVSMTSIGKVEIFSNVHQED